MSKYLTIITLIFHAQLLVAQTIQPGRPTQAFGTATMPAGGFQIETGGQVTVRDSLTTFRLNQMIFRYGVVNNFDVYATINLDYAKSFAPRPISQTTALGLRARLVNQKRVQLTYWGGATIANYPELPTSNQVIALAHAVGKNVTFGYCVVHNYDFNQINATNYIGDFQGSFLVTIQLLDRIACFIGLNTYWEEQFELAYDAGVTYLAKDNLQFDLFFGQGLNHHQHFYGLGLSWLFRKKS